MGGVAETIKFRTFAEHSAGEEPVGCTRILSSVGLERLSYKQRVVGSNPTGSTAFQKYSITGSLAQLV